MNFRAGPLLDDGGSDELGGGSLLDGGGSLLGGSLLDGGGSLLGGSLLLGGGGGGGGSDGHDGHSGHDGQGSAHSSFSHGLYFSFLAPKMSTLRLNNCVPPSHLASRKVIGGPLLDDGSLLESQPQTGTAHVPPLPAERNCPQTKVSRMTGNVIESPDRDGHGISTSTVPVSPCPGGHDGSLGVEGSLGDDGSLLDGGGGGGGSLLGGSLDEGGSLLDGGSLEDGGSLDDGGSLLDGGSLEDGSLLDGGSLDDDELGCGQQSSVGVFRSPACSLQLSNSHMQLSAQCRAMPQVPAGSVLSGNPSGAWTVNTRLTGRHLASNGSNRTRRAAAAPQGSSSDSSLNRQWSS
jgi:hypothetical protein